MDSPNSGSFKSDKDLATNSDSRKSDKSAEVVPQVSRKCPWDDVRDVAFDLMGHAVSAIAGGGSAVQIWRHGGAFDVALVARVADAILDLVDADERAAERKAEMGTTTVVSAPPAHNYLRVCLECGAVSAPSLSRIGRSNIVTPHRCTAVRSPGMTCTGVLGTLPFGVER